MLKDSSRFFYKAATLFWVSHQNCIKLTLSHDYMHLSADAAIAQQFLNIKEAATLTIYLVVALTISEENSGDCYFSKIDRKCTIGVIDGDCDFCASKWSTTRSAGKDDIFHLSAAKALCPLLAHDPGQSIENIAFARTIWSDDAGDSWFKSEGGWGCKGLEAL